jgi:hypothetical protein
MSRIVQNLIRWFSEHVATLLLKTCIKNLKLSGAETLTISVARVLQCVNGHVNLFSLYYQSGVVVFDVPR